MNATYKQFVLEALYHERAARWSEAARSWEEARKLAASHVSEGLAVERRDQAVDRELEVGQVLRHICRGVERAVCVYAGENDFVYRGMSYTTISAAAQAAARDIGLKSKSNNGWHFWGVEKREYRRDTDPREERDT